MRLATVALACVLAACGGGGSLEPADIEVGPIAGPVAVSEPADEAPAPAPIVAPVGGKRAFLQALAGALDAMPRRVLYAGAFEYEEGHWCALGVLAESRGIDGRKLDGLTRQEQAQLLGAEDPTWLNEVIEVNDNWRVLDVETNVEMRWSIVREWLTKQLV